MEKPNFFNLTFEELKSHLKHSGKEAFRAQQLFAWVYRHRQTDFEQMSNLSKAFRTELPDLLRFELPALVHESRSTDGTRKYLFDVGDGQTVEAVLIPHEDRMTLCVSSEVGCNMACKFCFTGKQKLKKRLQASDIVGQFLTVSDSLPEGQRITNIVFMGMGEPLDNPGAVFNSVAILHNEWGMNFSRKKVTVSTSGLVPQIPLVTESGTRLAVSLNAPNDEIRDFIMPINKKYPIESLLAACKEHAEKSRDRVTFEYVLLKDLNDDLSHARQLWQIVRQVPCKINLIPFNEHPDSGFQRPDRDKVFAFQRFLMSKNLHVTIRKTMGRDIFAACGQLTSFFETHPKQMNAQTGVLG
jgi:23S rRNA (adenine2503-C2)-methyltransferase